MANSNFKYQGSDLDSLLIPKSAVWQPGERKTLFMTGWNNVGQLGLADQSNRSSLTQVGTSTNWSSIATGSMHTVAIKTDGTLWAWGANYYGGLGLNDITHRSSPVQVGSLTTWSKIAAGSYYTAAIKTDGTLWTWGYNGYGSLGVNNTTMYSSPVQVGLLTTWANVYAGDNHTIAIKTDGTLWAWGRNTDISFGSIGCLGLNDTINRSSPVQVGSLTNWSSAATGQLHTIAIKTDGTLWAWGKNTERYGYYGMGQLGLGDSNTYSSPVQVGSLTTWSKVSTRGLSSYGIKTNGTLWSWGGNYYGMLGLGDPNTHRSSPNQVGTLTNWSLVSAGGSHAAAIKTDGTLWVWGEGSRGQLGLNNISHRSSPVQVGSLTSWAYVSSGNAQITAAIQAL